MEFKIPIVTHIRDENVWKCSLADGTNAAVKKDSPRQLSSSPLDPSAILASGLALATGAFDTTFGEPPSRRVFRASAGAHFPIEMLAN
jgi:hypothetical protein